MSEKALQIQAFGPRRRWATFGRSSRPARTLQGARDRRPSALPTGWALALACALLGACATTGQHAPGPEATVATFSQALVRGDIELAYAMMSDDYRARVSRAQFERLLQENGAETLALTEALSRVRGKAPQRATVQYDQDGELELERGAEGHWFITSNVVDFYDQSTPRAALRAFVMAMERKRYDVVIRLVPLADKEGITQERMQEAWSGEGREEVERLLSNLRNHMDAPIEVAGDHAIMAYGDHLRMQFVREEGVWKVEDPE